MPEYTCEHCDKIFSQISHYKRHINAKIKCCDRIFKRANDNNPNFKQSLEANTCIFCKSTFASQKSVTQHIKLNCKEFKRLEQEKKENEKKSEKLKTQEENSALKKKIDELKQKNLEIYGENNALKEKNSEIGQENKLLKQMLSSMLKPIV